MLRICKCCANPAEVVWGARGKIGSDQSRKSRSNPVREKSGFQVTGSLFWRISCLLRASYHTLALRAKGWLLKMESLGLLMIFHHSAMCCLHLLCIQIAEPTRFCHALPLQISHFRAHIHRRYYSKCIQVLVFEMLISVCFNRFLMVSNHPGLLQANFPKQPSQPRSAGCSLHFHLLPGYQGSEGKGLARDEGKER